MKYIAIIDDDMLNENDKRELRVPVLEKEGTSYVNLKPLVTHILTIKDGENIYLTQGHLDCLMEYSQKKIIEMELEREKRFFDDLKLFADNIAKMKGENK